MPSIDDEYLTTLLVDLVRINSSNPSLTPGSPGEAEIAEYLAHEMESIGLEVHKHEISPGRNNVVGILKGLDSDNFPSLMWNAHLDTVGTQGMKNPFSGEIRNSRVYGRGSQDMKGSLAAMLAAAKCIVEGEITLLGDLILTAVADEEYASIGTTDIICHYKADAAIVTEPTGLSLARAHRGFIVYKVITEGRAAHGSRFEEGIDSIMRMGRFLAELNQLELQLRQRRPHPLVGPPSLHTGLIRGGTEVSVYAAECTLFIERRTIPGETHESVTAEFQNIIDKLSEDDPTFKATLDTQITRTPFEISPDAQIVKTVEAALAAYKGTAPEHKGVTFWTDASLLTDAGIECVVIGPIGDGLHSVEEWVDIASLVDLALILTDSAIRYCNQK